MESSGVSRGGGGSEKSKAGAEDESSDRVYDTLLKAGPVLDDCQIQCECQKIILLLISSIAVLAV